MRYSYNRVYIFIHTSHKQNEYFSHNFTENMNVRICGSLPSGRVRNEFIRFVWNVNNEIVYAESGKYPLKCRILKQQLKFWIYLRDYCERSPDSALKHFLEVANQIDLPYIKWYQSLEERYTTPENCQRSLEAEFNAK